MTEEKLKKIVKWLIKGALSEILPELGITNGRIEVSFTRVVPSESWDTFHVEIECAVTKTVESCPDDAALRKLEERLKEVIDELLTIGGEMQRNEVTASCDEESHTLTIRIDAYYD